MREVFGRTSPKPLMQIAFEKVANEAVSSYMAQHADEIKKRLEESAKAQFEERLTKEGSYLLDQVFQKAREAVRTALGSRY